MKKAIAILFLISFKIGFSQDSPYVKIGHQTWMQKNLDKTIFRNGEKIKEIKSKEEWFKAGYREEPAWCYYNFDSKNANLGKLYNYFAVSDPRNIAPIGWRVPSFQDFYTLVNLIDPLCTKKYFANNGSLAGGSLKIKDNINWVGDNCSQISSNFNAIPAGGYSPSFDYPEYDWDRLNESAMFWCITKWENVNEFIDESDLDQFRTDRLTGKFRDKSIVIRLRKGNCKIDGDDDPKLNGYYLRLLKDN